MWNVLSVIIYHHHSHKIKSAIFCCNLTSALPLVICSSLWVNPKIVSQNFQIFWRAVQPFLTLCVYSVIWVLQCSVGWVCKAVNALKSLFAQSNVGYYDDMFVPFESIVSNLHNKKSPVKSLSHRAICLISNSLFAQFRTVCWLAKKLMRKQVYYM